MNNWSTVIGLLLWAGLIMVTVVGCCRGVAMRSSQGPAAADPGAAASPVGAPTER